jgi:hypothetical protein
MNLPQNGRVVVIDDKIDEGLPLVKVLAKKGVPTTYFTGLDKDELPSEPIQDVRLVFLDIVIGPKQSEKNQIAIVGNILRKIIGPENSPYILIAWTKHKELIEKIKNITGVSPPLITLNLEKYKCVEENYDLGKIESMLKQELEKAGVFHLFVLWENIVHKSANQIIKEFTSFYENDSNWDRNLSNILFHLASAYAGKQLVNEKKDIIQNGMLTFNGTFIDSLENTMQGLDYSEININFNHRKEISENICAKINSKLLLIESIDSRPTHPGNIYEIKDSSSLKVNVQELFNQEFDKYTRKEDFLKKIKFIQLEVSPTCDFAQGKWRLSRLLPGVMWPSDHLLFYSKKKKRDVGLIKGAEYIYSSPLFEKNDQTFKMVFDFRYLITSPFTALDKIKPSFVIRHQLLVDIQSHLARHINRPGVTFIKEEKKNKKKN